MSSPPPWGCPWHGRVQGGQLTLPNGEQLAWPQPDGTRRLEYPTNRAAWQTHNAGTTHLVQMPDAPPVDRSTEELAEDAAAGRTWLNKALLVGSGSGANPESYLHGHAVDGWVYAAPDGSRWMARALGEYSWDGAGLVIPMTVRRFGVLGGRPVAYNAYLQLSLAGMGQPAGATGKAKVDAIRPDGAQAIIRLYQGTSASDAVGFLLVTLTGTPGVGDFAASLTMLHSAAETAGVVEIDNAATDGRSKVQLQVTTSESQEDHRSGSPPSCAGYLDTIKTYSPSLVGVPLTEPAGYIVASGVNSVKRTGAIVAAWFNAAGEIEDVRLDIEKTRVVSLPAPSISYSGRDVFRQSNINGDGVCVLSGMSQIERFTTTRSRTSSRTDTVLIRLRVAGHQVEVSGSQTETVTSSYTGSGSNQTSSLDTDTTGTTFGWPSESHQHGSGGTISGTEGVEFYAFSLSDAQLSVGYNPAGSGGYNVEVKRWANNLFGLMTRKPRGYGSTLDSINWSQALSPAGVVPGVSEDVAADDDVSPWYTRRPFGSFNPLTGEAVIAEAEPVSWT